MRRSGPIFIFVAAILVFGALLSPWIYWSMQGAARSFPALRPVADHPFPRFVSRTLMLATLAGLWPLYRALGRPSRETLGLTMERDWKPKFLLACGAGFLTLALLVTCALLFGAREWRLPPAGLKLVRTILLSVTAAVLVAPVEEILFRGVLFGSLRSRGRWLGPLLLSSVVFAAVHFLQTPKGSGPVTGWSGFEVLGAMSTGGAAEHRGTQFVNLALCGALLAWLFQRTGSLTFSIGLHSGWILCLKLANAFTVVTASGEFWGTRRVIDGWATTLFLLLLAAALPALTRKAVPPTAHVPDVSHPAAALG